MPNDNLVEVYNSVKKRNPNLPDISTFEQDMKNPANLEALYNSVKKYNPNLPDLDTFSSDIGIPVKKKEFANPSVGVQTIGSTFSQQPPAESPSASPSNLAVEPSGLPSGQVNPNIQRLAIPKEQQKPEALAESQVAHQPQTPTEQPFTQPPSSTAVAQPAIKQAIDTQSPYIKRAIIQQQMADRSGMGVKVVTPTPEEAETLATSQLHIADKTGAKEDFNKAITDYDTAIDLNPDKTQLVIERGALHLQTGSFDKALKDANLAIKNTPDTELNSVNQEQLISAYNVRKQSLKGLNDEIGIAETDKKIQEHQDKYNKIKDIEKYDKSGNMFADALQKPLNVINEAVVGTAENAITNTKSGMEDILGGNVIAGTEKVLNGAVGGLLTLTLEGQEFNVFQ